MSSEPDSPQDSHLGKYWPWYVVALLVVVLAVGIFFVTKKRSGDENFTKTESQILADITAYGGRYELDAEGHIERLLLEGPQVTDEALADVHTLPHLRRLSLARSSVTDKGLLAVLECKRLQNLGLTNTRVTDAGLAQLRQMASLQNVWVTENDKLTPRGVAALRKALPATNINVMSQPAVVEKNE